MTNLTIERSINQNTFHLSEKTLTALTGIMYEQQVEAGTYLFWEGDTADKLFYIKEGNVKQIKGTSDGKEYILNMFDRGDLFGEMSSFMSIKYSYNAVALTDCTIGVIQQKDLEILLWQHGEIAVEFLKWTALLNQITQSKLRDLTFHGKLGALCSTMIRMANSYGEEVKDGIRLTKKVKNGELGEYIGATRESVNRMLSDLRSKKIISQEKGYLLIHDLDALKDICHCENCPLEICRM
ncbi:transcriptional regulator [Halalkalibacter wakoensis JCM 9140]|uniref:Transcriptional regulator n=1 Tax=Halalkalibacter wakoensis JCM 9140 TaxID=1236970 RepID=W4Q0F1_9BACI|nr:Crp/Fnr family transcriptional regulator [Halalkalibacter wakoensis]GAE25203.1 transcriptional regulator [Halalkalibacter wakoensis JCM 9140]